MLMPAGSREPHHGGDEVGNAVADAAGCWQVELGQETDHQGCQRKWCP